MSASRTLEPGTDNSCCPSTLLPGLGAEEAAGKSLAFKALADPNRLRLLSLVAAGPGGEACVCDLTAPLGLGQPTVSHHLRILVDAGLLHREKRGTWAYFSVVPGALEAISHSILALSAHAAGPTPATRG